MHEYRILKKCTFITAYKSGVAVYWLEVSAALMMHEE